MKIITYTSYQKLLVKILLLVFLFQNCNMHPGEAPLPKKRAKQPPIAQLTFISQGGHEVELVGQNNTWIAVVNENLPQGFSRQVSLPVKEVGLSVAGLAKKHDPSWQKYRLQVVFSEQGSNSKGYVLIGNQGLLGGGNDKDKGKEEEKGADEEEKEIEEGAVWHVYKNRINAGERVVSRGLGASTIEQQQKGEKEKIVGIKQEDHLKDYDYSQLTIALKPATAVNDLTFQEPINTTESGESYQIENKRFKRQNVLGEGMRCFFNAAGLSAQEQIYKLEEHKGNPIVRYMIANEIVSAAKTPDELPEAVKTAIQYSLYKQEEEKINDLRERRNQELAKQSSNPLEQKIQHIDKELQDIYPFCL